jgi:hypothetical protein
LSSMGRVRTSALASTAFVLLAVSACDDNRKASEQAAVDTLTQLAPVLKEDVGEVRRGLPQGASLLGPMLDPDTVGSPVGLQKAIAGARAHVKDLEVAKSTFFSYADATGTVLRSEADPDVLAGKSIVAAFPPLKKVLDPGGAPTDAWAEVKDLRGARNGPDLIWAIAAPVKNEKGDTKGMFVTGWSLRSLAYHLETSARMAAVEAAEKAGKKNPPLVYVFVVKGKTAYGTPLAPDVNAHALEALDVLGKTAGGPYRSNLDITGRGFGVAGARAPELGDDVVLAILASEI